MSLPTFIAMVTLAGVGVGAWVDVKSDIRENGVATEHNKESDQRIEKSLDKLEGKVDKVLEYLLNQKDSNTDG